MHRKIKFYLSLAALLLLFACQLESPQSGAKTAAAPTLAEDAQINRQLYAAFKTKKSKLWLQLTAQAVKILSDDNKGIRHQRFIVKTLTGHSVLIVHNIDLAPRVPVALGDRISAYGEYIWNQKGGLLHFTHHNPRPQRKPYRGGWIVHHGQKYR